MFAVSAGVAVCSHFIPSTLGVVLFSVITGFLLSLDLSQVGTLCDPPRGAFGGGGNFRKGGSATPHQRPPSSFGWTLGCGEAFLYLTLLLAAVTEAGLLHHFLGSVHSQSLVTGPQAPVSYLLLVLFCLCWVLREIQGAYVLGGVFLNPLYPKGLSCVATFKQRNRGLYAAAAVRRVLLYFGELVIISSASLPRLSESSAVLNVDVLLFDHFPFVPHSVSVCNDCVPVRGQISAAPPQGLSQRGIYASLQIGNHAASVLMCNMQNKFRVLTFRESVLRLLHRVLLAGVAKFRGCSPADGGGGCAATCSEKQHVANVGQPGNWRSASTGEFGDVGSRHILLFTAQRPHLLLIILLSLIRNADNCSMCHCISSNLGRPADRQTGPVSRQAQVHADCVGNVLDGEEAATAVRWNSPGTQHLPVPPGVGSRGPVRAPLRPSLAPLHPTNFPGGLPQATAKLARTCRYSLSLHRLHLLPADERQSGLSSADGLCKRLYG